MRFCIEGDSIFPPWNATSSSWSRCAFNVMHLATLSATLIVLSLVRRKTSYEKHPKNPSIQAALERVQRASRWSLVALALVTFTHLFVVYGLGELCAAQVLNDVLAPLVFLIVALGALNDPTHRAGRWIMGFLSWTALVLCLVELAALGNASFSSSTQLGAAQVSLFALRLLPLLSLVALNSGLVPFGILRRGTAAATASSNGYASLNTTDADVDLEEGDAPPTTPKSKPADGEVTKKRTTSAFNNFWSNFRRLWPFLWPKGRPALQFRVFLCFILLILGRVVNLFVPVFFERVVNSLTPTSTHGALFDARDLALYLVLRFLQGGGSGLMGFLNNVRQFLWILVSQYTTRSISLEVFAHLHSLSLRWHLGRKTGEVLRIVDRGTTSVNGMLQTFLFSIVPTFVDIGIAVAYFVTRFNLWFGLIVLSTAALYVLFTILCTEWRTQFRRDMNLLDNRQRSRAVDSLLGFETVKYFGAEHYEHSRFAAAIDEYQLMSWKSSVSLNFLNFGQSFIITAGLAGGTFLCAWSVAYGSYDVGAFVLFITYMSQICAPLNYLGSYYRVIQQQLVDLENLHDLLEIEPEIRDCEGAEELVRVTTESSTASSSAVGDIEFDSVSFHYTPLQPVLRDVSFRVPQGHTVALVGHTGSGKSSIIRLLFRLYEPVAGNIRIGGRDVRELTQQSLRSAMGVVPQDTVLFNDTIRFNIRYGRPTATDAEVEAAAQAASIHSSIMERFPEQYDTKVGERGLRLSGGEVQRVAIARTMLKGAPIVLLDEATSALDSLTEREIQQSLTSVTNNKTTVVVAHRLSTIMHANEILVLHEGRIHERGTHAVLLSLGGLYADMWRQQKEEVEVETDAVEK